MIDIIVIGILLKNKTETPPGMYELKWQVFSKEV